jgi:hypothetical protein
VTTVVLLVVIYPLLGLIIVLTLLALIAYPLPKIVRLLVARLPSTQGILQSGVATTPQCPLEVAPSTAAGRTGRTVIAGRLGWPAPSARCAFSDSAGRLGHASTTAVNSASSKWSEPLWLGYHKGERSKPTRRQQQKQFETLRTKLDARTGNGARG